MKWCNDGKETLMYSPPAPHSLKVVLNVLLWAHNCKMVCLDLISLYLSEVFTHVKLKTRTKSNKEKEKKEKSDVRRKQDDTTLLEAGFFRRGYKLAPSSW